MSLTLYVPAYPGKLAQKDLDALSECGFPVNAWRKSRKWCPEDQTPLPPRRALAEAHVATSDGAPAADTLSSIRDLREKSLVETKNAAICSALAALGDCSVGDMRE
eukprot:5271274-Amphidinium_carterae.1